jgi:hypothetical protein
MGREPSGLIVLLPMLPIGAFLEAPFAPAFKAP